MKVKKSRTFIVISVCFQLIGKKHESVKADLLNFEKIMSDFHQNLLSEPANFYLKICIKFRNFTS